MVVLEQLEDVEARRARLGTELFLRRKHIVMHNECLEASCQHGCTGIASWNLVYIVLQLAVYHTFMFKKFVRCYSSSVYRHPASFVCSRHKRAAWHSRASPLCRRRRYKLKADLWTNGVSADKLHAR